MGGEESTVSNLSRMCGRYSLFFFSVSFLYIHFPILMCLLIRIFHTRGRVSTPGNVYCSRRRKRGAIKTADSESVIHKKSDEIVRESARVGENSQLFYSGYRVRAERGISSTIKHHALSRFLAKLDTAEGRGIRLKNACIGYTLYYVEV